MRTKTVNPTWMHAFHCSLQHGGVRSEGSFEHLLEDPHRVNSAVCSVGLKRHVNWEKLGILCAIEVDNFSAGSCFVHRTKEGRNAPCHSASGTKIHLWGGSVRINEVDCDSVVLRFEFDTNEEWIPVGPLDYIVHGGVLVEAVVHCDGEDNASIERQIFLTGHIAD